MWGDSRTTGPEFTASPPGLEFDLVFIDGGHSYEVARADLLNMRELSSESTAVIIDDLVPRYAFGVGPTWAWKTPSSMGLCGRTNGSGTAGCAAGRWATMCSSRDRVTLSASRSYR